MWIETRLHVEMRCDDICERWQKHEFDWQQLTLCALLSHAVCIRIWWVYIPNLIRKIIKHYIWSCYNWKYNFFFPGLELNSSYDHVLNLSCISVFSQFVFFSSTNNSFPPLAVSGLQQRWGRHSNTYLYFYWPFKREGVLKTVFFGLFFLPGLSHKQRLSNFNPSQIFKRRSHLAASSCCRCCWGRCCRRPGCFWAGWRVRVGRISAFCIRDVLSRHCFQRLLCPLVDCQLLLLEVCCHFHGDIIILMLMNHCNAANDDMKPGRNDDTHRLQAVWFTLK